jgi:hypothetical protein
MLVESIVRQTLGIKRHVVKAVVQGDEGIEAGLLYTSDAADE